MNAILGQSKPAREQVNEILRNTDWRRFWDGVQAARQEEMGRLDAAMFGSLKATGNKFVR
jgi:hypothetical protein